MLKAAAYVVGAAFAACMGCPAAQAQPAMQPQSSPETPSLRAQMAAPQPAPRRDALAVSLQGLLGRQALLVIGQGAPKAVPPGQTHQGVKVISTSGDSAVVEVEGQRHTLRLGATPVSVAAAGGGASSGAQVALTADGQGHFFSMGYIGNQPVRFMVDTGASTVAIGQAEADRMRLNYRQGRQLRVRTANGEVVGWQLRLHSVRLGDVTVYGVDAVVLPTAMPVALLGNSFLNRFSMQREGSRMMLTRR